MGGDWKLILVILGIFIIVYNLAMTSSELAKFVIISGILYGGGTVIVNYARSFKENMIDSNRKVSV